MTNELEKQFFDAFGIKPDVISAPNYHWEDYVMQYPQISDRILLELICIIGSIYICTQDIESLKEHILVQCMNTQMYGGDIKHQVRTLFEEG